MVVSDILVHVHGFRMLLNFAPSAKSTKAYEIKSCTKICAITVYKIVDMMCA